MLRCMVICSGAVLLIFALFVELGGFGLVCPFDMFKVVLTVECPNAPDTETMSTPSLTSIEAKRCRNAMKTHY